MLRIGIISIFALTFSVFGQNVVVSQEKKDQKKKQDKTELRQDSSRVDDKIIDKALKFLASSQLTDGSWMEGKDSDKENYTTMFYKVGFTSLGGLALLASGSTTKEGPYKAELIKAVNRVKKTVQKMIKTCHSWLEIPVLFLGHVYKIEKSEELKELLLTLRDILLKRQRKEGGWDYGPVPDLTYKPEILVTNNTIIALMLLQHVGIDIDNKVFKRAIEFYEKGGLQSKEGGFYYRTSYELKKFMKVEPKSNDWTLAGRTVEALWPLELLEATKGEMYENAKNYAKKYIHEIDRSQHGAAYHCLFAGMSCYYGKDRTMWKKYQELFWEKIVKAQKEDGSIQIVPREGGEQSIDLLDTAVLEKKGMRGVIFGAVYTTSMYAILLQLQKNNLLFDKLKYTKGTE